MSFCATSAFPEQERLNQASEPPHWALRPHRTGVSLTLTSLQGCPLQESPSSIKRVDTLLGLGAGPRGSPHLKTWARAGLAAQLLLAP